MHWLQLGDHNNKAFHNAAKIRETNNVIREIKCPSGEVVITQEGIKKKLKDFSMSFYLVSQMISGGEV